MERLTGGFLRSQLRGEQEQEEASQAGERARVCVFQPKEIIGLGRTELP